MLLALPVVDGCDNEYEDVDVLGLASGTLNDDPQDKSNGDGPPDVPGVAEDATDGADATLSKAVGPPLLVTPVDDAAATAAGSWAAEAYEILLQVLLLFTLFVVVVAVEPVVGITKNCWAAAVLAATALAVAVAVTGIVVICTGCMVGGSCGGTAPVAFIRSWRVSSSGVMASRGLRTRSHCAGLYFFKPARRKAASSSGSPWKKVHKSFLHPSSLK